MLRLFNQISAYNTLADALHAGELAEAIRHPLGVLTGARPALLAALHSDLQRPILFITARADRARILTEQIRLWEETPSTVYRLPNPDSLPFEKVAWSSETVQGRLAALSALVVYHQSLNKSGQMPPSASPRPAPFIVTSARALMQYTLPLTEFSMMTFKVGQRISLNQVLRQWVELGYRPEEVVEVAGSFSRRGGILDVFPPANPPRCGLNCSETRSIPYGVLIPPASVPKLVSRASWLARPPKLCPGASGRPRLN